MWNPDTDPMDPSGLEYRTRKRLPCFFDVSHDPTYPIGHSRERATTLVVVFLLAVPRASARPFRPRTLDLRKPSLNAFTFDG